MFFRSERLFLRPAWPEDAADLHPLINDEALARNLARVPWPYRIDDARAFATMPQTPQLPHFVITLPQAQGGARLVGTVGLADCDGEVELGYWIGRACQGLGYATEAARAVLRMARTLGHRRIIASHFADNHASRRVLAKLGFTPTGQVRPRTSPARGVPEPAVVHALDLVPPASDPGDPFDPMMLPRAA